MIDLTLDLKTIITILGILVAAILTIYFQWWRNRKSLFYSVLQISDIKTLPNDREELRILYKGRFLKNIHAISIEVVNDGKQSIDEADFKKDIDFIFSEHSKILLANINSKSPANLDIQYTFIENKFSIKPVLLNSNECFEAFIFLEGEVCDFIIDSRIKGLHTKKPHNAISTLKKLHRNTAIISSVLLIVVIFLIYLFSGLIIDLDLQNPELIEYQNSINKMYILIQSSLFAVGLLSLSLLVISIYFYKRSVDFERPKKTPISDDEYNNLVKKQALIEFATTLEEQVKINKLPKNTK